MQKEAAAEPAQPGQVLHDFGEKMKAARSKAGIRQANLQTLLMDGYGIKLDTSGITRMEAGEREPRLSEAIAIAAILGMEISDLISTTRDLNRQIGDIVDLLARTRENVASLLRAADEITEYVTENPDSLGGRNLEDLINQAIDRVPAEIQTVSGKAKKSAGGADKLKRQLLSAVTAGPPSGSGRDQQRR